VSRCCDTCCPADRTRTPAHYDTRRSQATLRSRTGPQTHHRRSPDSATCTAGAWLYTSRTPAPDRRCMHHIPPCRSSTTRQERRAPGSPESWACRKGSRAAGCRTTRTLRLCHIPNSSTRHCNSSGPQQLDTSANPALRHTHLLRRTSHTRQHPCHCIRCTSSKSRNTLCCGCKTASLPFQRTASPRRTTRIQLGNLSRLHTSQCPHNTFDQSL
jgi:hypothetical protein